MDGLHCAFIGRVVGEGAQLRYTSTGTPLVNMTLLVQDSKAADGEGQFARVGHFGDDAEQLAEQLTKGVECYCEGKLKMNTWTAGDGTPRSGLNVTAWRLEPVAQIGRRAPGRAPVHSDAPRMMPQHMAIPRRSTFDTGPNGDGDRAA